MVAVGAHLRRQVVVRERQLDRAEAAAFAEEVDGRVVGGVVIARRELPDPAVDLPNDVLHPHTLTVPAPCSGETSDRRR